MTKRHEVLDAWLKEHFCPFPTVSPAGNGYTAYPVFSGPGKLRSLEHDAMADTCDVGDLKIRIRQYSPTLNSLDPTTGSYLVGFEIVEPDETYQDLVKLTKELARSGDATAVLRALTEALTADELAFLGENLFVSERNPL
jgi:hypothetical protein